MKLSKERLNEIEAFVDEDISDIPELTNEELARMQSSHLRNPENFRPIKKKISMFIDADVLEYYKSKGKGYQTRINRILRNEMLREIAPAYGSEHDMEDEHES